jgi:hypothetical protein
MITRRQIASALAASGMTGLLGAPPGTAEPPPETTRLRFVVIPDSIFRAASRRIASAGGGFIQDTPQEIVAKGLEELKG